MRIAIEILAVVAAPFESTPRSEHCTDFAHCAECAKVAGLRILSLALVAVNRKSLASLQ
jgi:hypothetical protein